MIVGGIVWCEINSSPQGPQKGGGGMGIEVPLSPPPPLVVFVPAHFCPEMLRNSMNSKGFGDFIIFGVPPARPAGGVLPDSEK